MPPVSCPDVSGIAVRMFRNTQYQAGLLSHEKETIKGVEIAPFDVIYAHVPPAPKSKEEIKKIIDEGLLLDSGCMVVEAYGVKDNNKILVETHINAPGLVESFERAGISAEMYITGQSGYLFTKMFINDKFTQKGLISSDMLTLEQVDCYFDYAREFDITLNTSVKKL
jgi:saccharopine dehydrogenase-like NADP-dependent oxidoreductase